MYSIGNLRENKQQQQTPKKALRKSTQPSMIEFESAMRRVRQYIMAQPTPDCWPSERVGDPRLVPEPYTLAMRFMGKKTETMKRRKGENGMTKDYTARAANCFILFRMHVHQVAVSLFPAETKTLQDKLSARAGVLWKELCSEAKDMFAREAKQMERFHKVQFPNYKYRPTKHKKLPTDSHPVSSSSSRPDRDNIAPSASYCVNDDKNLYQDKHEIQTFRLFSKEDVRFPEALKDHLTVIIPPTSTNRLNNVYDSSYNSSALSPNGSLQSPTSSLEMTYNSTEDRSSPFCSSLPPPTPIMLKTHYTLNSPTQQRPSSLPDQESLHRVHFNGRAGIKFITEDVEMNKLLLDLQDECQKLQPLRVETEDPFISYGVVLLDDATKGESSASTVPQPLIDWNIIMQSSDRDRDMATLTPSSAMYNMDISWLQALQSVGQGFGGACLSISSGFLNAPLPEDLIDIPLRNWEPNEVLE